MSLLQSPIAPQIKDFLRFLGPDDVESIARTASNNRISPMNTDEAIEVVLLHTSDVGKLFSYKRIRSQSLFTYLHKHRVATTTNASKTQLMMTIYQFWNTQMDKNGRDQPLAKRRASDPSGHHNRGAEVDNSALTCNTSYSIPKVSLANRSFSESEQSAVCTSYQNFSESERAAVVTSYTTNITEYKIVNSQPQFPNSKGSSNEAACSVTLRSDEFTKNFCEWYYTMVNRLQPECAHQNGDNFRENIFFNNSTVDIFLIGQGNEENHSQGAKDNFTLISGVFKKHRLLFSPNLESGTQAHKSSHGMVKIFCCGTLFQADSFIGIFEQEFGLMVCPVARAWKIMYTKMNLKQSASLTVPSLPSCEIFEIEN